MLTKREETTLKRLEEAVKSDCDPHNNPEFPATPTYQIEVPGFDNVWLKDESKNKNGVHKDRMAWEILIAYKAFLSSKKTGRIDNLPQMSIITSGTAGYVIQKRLKEYGLPTLKCLVDSNIDEKISEKLHSVGCDVYKVDLSKSALKAKDILNITNNKFGIDITSSKALDPTRKFYDWLSYEVLNVSPDYSLVPFGTGNLYENILNTAKKEITAVKHDPRFQSNVEKLRNCHFLGATTKDPASKATKLYAPHLPFSSIDDQWMKYFKLAAFCGEKSDVRTLKEAYLDKAIELGNALGLTFEPSGIAGLGLLLQMRNEVPRDAKILIINTGKTK